MRGPTQARPNPPNGWMKCIQSILTITYIVLNWCSSYFNYNRGENTMGGATNITNTRLLMDQKIFQFFSIFNFRGSNGKRFTHFCSKD